MTLKLYQVTAYDPCFDNGYIDFLVGAESPEDAIIQVRNEKDLGGDVRLARNIVSAGARSRRNVTEWCYPWLQPVKKGVIVL